VTLRFSYLALLRLLGWIAVFAQADLAKDAEILILRHQIAVLQRHVKDPGLPGDLVRADPVAPLPPPQPGRQGPG
jgi:hypothetical protein